MSAGVQIVRHLFTADEYEQMIEAGILGEEDRVELLDGEIVEVSPIGSAHAACVDRLNMLLVERTGGRAIVRVQSPVRLGEHSIPEPDLVLLHVKDDFYAAAHPGPQDILLAIEVADTSIDSDRNVKLPLYAAAGVAEVWLIDLNGERVEVHREPHPGGYAAITIHWRGDSLETSTLEMGPIAVVDVLGRN